MGRKRTGKGKHVSFFVACCLTFMFGGYGCTGILRTQSHGDRPGEMYSHKRAGQEALVKARVLLEHGEYEASLREAEAVLEAHAKILGDEALLLTGLIYAYPDNPDKDYRKSLERFERLKQEYPESQENQLAVWFSLLVSETAEKDRRIAELTEKLEDLEKTVVEEQAKQKKLKQETVRLQEQTQVLKDQLEKLKEIDLVIEQKKHEAQ